MGVVRRVLVGVMVMCLGVVGVACGNKDGIEVLASGSFPVGAVAGIAMESEPAVYVGGSVLALDGDEVQARLTLSSEYRDIAWSERVRSQGTGEANRVRLADGRLLHAREVVDGTVFPIGDGRIDRIELVAIDLSGDEASAEALFTAPRIEEFAIGIVGEDSLVVCRCSEIDLDGVPTDDWLSGFLVSADGKVTESWRTPDTFGDVRSFALAEESDDVRIGVLTSGWGGESPRLAVFDGQGTLLDELWATEGETPQTDRLAESVFAYDDGKEIGWLVHWVGDSDALTLSSPSGGTREILAGDHFLVLDVGELSADSAGDEIVLRVVKVTGGSSGGGEEQNVASSVEIVTATGGKLETLSSRPDACTEARIVDLDGDGQNEIVGVVPQDLPQPVSHRSVDRLAVYTVDATGSFVQRLLSPLPVYEMGLMGFDCIDLDGDGAREVVVSYEVLKENGEAEPRVDVLKVSPGRRVTN
jgi:hypothetical protein